MGRKAQVKRSAEEKWEILQEGLKSGNVSETCRKHGVAPNLWYRWKDEAEQGAKAALGGRSAAGGVDEEQSKRVKQLERALGRKQLEIEILKNGSLLTNVQDVSSNSGALCCDREDCYVSLATRQFTTDD